MGLFDKLFGKKHQKASSPKSTVCDICAKSLQFQEGYLLTTEKVVSTPAYWKKHLDETLTAALGPHWRSHPMLLVKMMEIQQAAANQVTPWMVCDICIELFSVDRAKTREWAQQWYESDRQFVPPGSGAVDLSKVKIS